MLHSGLVFSARCSASACSIRGSSFPEAVSASIWRSHRASSYSMNQARNAAKPLSSRASISRSIDSILLIGRPEVFCSEHCTANRAARLTHRSSGRLASRALQLPVAYPFERVASSRLRRCACLPAPLRAETNNGVGDEGRRRLMRDEKDRDLALQAVDRACDVLCGRLIEIAVASSKISTFGRLISARAIARRCFWPPDRPTPRSPISV